jgi:hypothetical protein
VKRPLIAVTACSAALAALLAIASARAGEGTPSVLDRTWSCQVLPRGGLRVLDARASAGVRNGSAWVKLPYAGLRTGPFSGPETGNLLAWVTAGRPDAATTADQEFETFDVETVGTIGVRRTLCRESRQPVPLGAKGLRGGPATQLGDAYECAPFRRVLVRIRATLASPATLRGDELQTAHVPATRAELAVRTPAGKRLVYADAAASGKARLFTAAGCTPD